MSREAVIPPPASVRFLWLSITLCLKLASICLHQGEFYKTSFIHSTHVPEVMADDPHPGPLLVPLDAVVVPAQRRVHLAAQGGRLTFPMSRGWLGTSRE